MAAFNTYDYDFLLRSLNEGSLFFKCQAIKRFTVLASSDKKQFSNYLRNILPCLQSLYKEDKQQMSLSATFLLNQIITQFPQAPIQPHLLHLILNLGHPSKAPLRKASHTCLLNYVKYHHDFQMLQEAYLCGLKHQTTLTQQKSTNSFQSILILEMKHYDFTSQMSGKMFAALVDKIDSDIAVTKAVTQCLISICKMEGVHSLLHALTPQQGEKLTAFLLDIQTKVDNLTINHEQVAQYVSKNNNKVQNSNVNNIINNNNNIINNNNNIINNGVQNEEKEKQPLLKQSDNQRRLQKIRNSLKIQEKKQKQKQHHPKLFVLNSTEMGIKDKIQSLQDMLYKMQVSKARPQFQQSIKSIFPTLIRQLKDNNPKVVGVVLKILQNIVEQVALHPTFLSTMITAVVEKLGDTKISIRQGVAKVTKQLIQKTNKGLWVAELLSNLRNSTSVALKDQTLSLLQHIYENDAAVEYSTQELLEQVVIYADDPKTKIKIRTLDCLATVVFQAKDRERYNALLRGKMNNIFYQMYEEKISRMEAEKNRMEIMRREEAKRQEKYKNVNNNNTINNSVNNQESGEEQNLNVSMQVVKKRVSLLRKQRNLLSTQQTISGQNSVQKQDVQIILPSLYKQTKTNRFINKRSTFTPNKTTQTKPSEYLQKDDLRPLSQPQRQLKRILAQLRSADWKTQFQATNKLRRMVQFHPQLLTQPSTIHSLTLDIVSMIQNLRSSVAKNALLCLSQFIIVLNKQIDPQMQHIMEKLIKKSADTNVFISSEVQRCLMLLSLNASPNKVLDKLATYRESKSIPIKEAVISTLLTMKDCKSVVQREYTKLAEAFAYYLAEGQVEVRSKAKNGIIQLCRVLGDWYRALRGKINPNCFKSVCELMTKAQVVRRQELVLTPIIKKEEIYHKEDIKSQRKIDKIQQKNKNENNTIITERKETIESIPMRKKITKISQFPDQFNEIQQILQMSNSSDWKKRIESLNKMQSLSLQYPIEFCQYRSSTHFMDVLSKQMQQSNIRVSLNAMSVLKSLFIPLKTLFESNLSVITNSVYTMLSSSKNEVREAAENCLTVVLEEVDLQNILQHLCQGISYSLPKSRIILLERLSEKIYSIYQCKKQLLFKHVFPLMNKLMEQYKTELMPAMIEVFQQIYDVMGKEMFSHLSKFKEVRELIQK